MVVNKGIEASSWLNIALGVFVIAIGYYQTTEFAGPFYSALVAGLVLIAVGAYSAWAAATERSRSTMWPAVAGLLAGLWLIAYPWFVGVNDTYFYSNVGAGVAAAIVSGYEIYAASVSGEKKLRMRTA